MKRTISLEASAAAAQLRNRGFAAQVACAGAVSSVAHSLALFGLGLDAQWPQVRQAYLARLRQFPPERCPEEFIHTVDAYDTLKRIARNAVEASAVAAEFSDSGYSGGAGKRRRVGESSSVVVMNTAVGAAGCSLPAGPSPVIALDMAGVCHLGASPAAAALPVQTNGTVPGGANVFSAPVASAAVGSNGGCCSGGCSGSGDAGGSVASSGSSGAPSIAAGFAGRPGTCGIAPPPHSWGGGHTAPVGVATASATTPAAQIGGFSGHFFGGNGGFAAGSGGSSNGSVLVGDPAIGGFNLTGCVPGSAMNIG